MAYKAVDRSGGDVQAEVIDSLFLAVAFCQTFDIEHVLYLLF